MSEERRRPGPARRTDWDAVVAAYKHPHATYKSVGVQFGISHVMVGKILSKLEPALMPGYERKQRQIKRRHRRRRDANGVKTAAQSDGSGRP